MTYTAIITARDENTTTEGPGSVDANVMFGGVSVGSVALVRDHDGRLVGWGSLDMWADDRVIDHIDEQGEDARSDVVDEIVGAVAVAAR